MDCWIIKKNAYKTGGSFAFASSMMKNEKEKVLGRYREQEMKGGDKKRNKVREYGGAGRSTRNEGG